MASLQMGDDYRSFKSQLELYFKQTLNFTSAGGLDTSGPMDAGGIYKGSKSGKGGKHQQAAGAVDLLIQQGELRVIVIVFVALVAGILLDRHCAQPVH